MQHLRMSRRTLLQMSAMLGAHRTMTRAGVAAAAAPPELSLPSDALEERVDFERTGIEAWTAVNGQWVVEESPGAASGKRVLVQRAIKQRVQRDRGPLGTLFQPPTSR